MATYRVNRVYDYSINNKVLHIWTDSLGNTRTCLADRGYKPKPLYKRF